MKQITILSLLVISLTISAYTISNSTWQITKGWEIKFATESAKGSFDQLAGEINFDANDLQNSSIKVNVAVASIATGNFLKTSHAKGEKWFDSKKYPKIVFTSEKFAKSKNGYVVEGQLEMHGIKREVTIPFQFQNNKFTGSFSVNRMDYKIGTMEGMSKKVGNEIKIDLVVPVTKK